jgi:hypothetical protein
MVENKPKYSRSALYGAPLRPFQWCAGGRFQRVRDYPRATVRVALRLGTDVELPALHALRRQHVQCFARYAKKTAFVSTCTNPWTFLTVTINSVQNGNGLISRPSHRLGCWEPIVTHDQLFTGVLSVCFIHGS